MQRLRDEAAGLDTGGFISGYRGSPLGGFDLELWRAKKQLEGVGVKFTPGLNEDLGATMVWGTQQTNPFPGDTVDGGLGDRQRGVAGKSVSVSVDFGGGR